MSVKNLPYSKTGRRRVSKDALFQAFAAGSKVRLTSSIADQTFSGTIVQIGMETGPINGEQPYRWIVKMVSDDDMVDLYVETF